MAKDIQYGLEKRQFLDVYSGGGPVLMMVSGGGWRTGSKDWISNIGTALSAQSITVVIPDHRLQPAVTYKDQIQDLALALKWTVENISDFGGNPQKVFVGGHSAGAHLVSLLALDRQYIHEVGLEADVIKGVIAVAIGIARFDDHSNPIDHNRETAPPFLCLVGEHDATVGLSTTRSLHETLEANNIPSSLHIISNRDHFNITHRIGTSGDETTRLMREWIRN